MIPANSLRQQPRDRAPSRAFFPSLARRYFQARLSGLLHGICITTHCCLHRSLSLPSYSHRPLALRYQVSNEGLHDRSRSSATSRRMSEGFFFTGQPRPLSRSSRERISPRRMFSSHFQRHRHAQSSSSICSRFLFLSSRPSLSFLLLLFFQLSFSFSFQLYSSEGHREVLHFST